MSNENLPENPGADPDCPEEQVPVVRLSVPVPGYEPKSPPERPVSTHQNIRDLSMDISFVSSICQGIEDYAGGGAPVEVAVSIGERSKVFIETERFRTEAAQAISDRVSLNITRIIHTQFQALLIELGDQLHELTEGL